MNYRRLGAMTRTLPFLLTVPGLAFGQPVQPPTRTEAAAALNPAPAVYSPAQLDQMLAPIALYPDQLLLELLMASTFPQQVIDAGTWLQDPGNAALSGDQLVAALQPLPWDPSVKALVAFPQIVKMLNDHLDWTEALGTAFANQQVAMMARVQFLRQRAVAAGRLASTPQLLVQPQDGDIIIEPVDPAMIYVPVYNPAEAYGQWPDSDAPPIYIPPPPGFYAGAIGAGIGFSIGFGVAAPLWGWGHPDWRRHEVVVDPRRYDRITSPANNARNQVRVDHETWHRTAPMVRVPQAQRPPPAAATAPRPAGTAASTAVALPKPAPAAPPHPGAGAPLPAAPPRPGAAAPSPAAPPHPGAAAPLPAAPSHPGAAAPSPGAPPHPGAAAPLPAAPSHPAAAAPAPAAPPRPGAAAPSPGAPPHPGAAAPSPAAPPHPGAAAPAPTAPPHPAAAAPAPPHPAAAAPAPAAAPHPTATAPSPGAPPHPAAAAPLRAAPPHPAAAAPPPPHPAAAAPPPPHPAAAAPLRAAPPHPAAAAPPPPHPAAAAPPPAKKPPPKPGEEEKGQH